MNSQHVGTSQIATYRDTVPGIRRQLTLYSDHITVYSKALGGDENEVHLPLQDVSPDIGFIRFRVQRWFIGFAISFVLALFIWLFVGAFDLSWSSPRVLIAATLCCISFAWGVYYLRRYRAFRFVNRSGVVVLDVIENGPDKDKCIDFVRRIEETIREIVKKSSEPVS